MPEYLEVSPIVRTILPLILLLSLPILGGAAAPQDAQKVQTAPFVALGEIDSEVDDKLTIVTVRLDQKPAWKAAGELQDHGSFLQLVLPDTLVPEPGKFIASDSPFVKKIAVFQLNQKDAGVRFFVGADAAATKDAASVELFDKRLVLTIDHAKLKGLLPAPSTTAEAVLAKTEVSRDIPSPAERLKNDKAAAKGATLAAGKGVDLREKLTQVAMFLGGLILFAGLALMVKPLIRKHKMRLAADRDENDAPVGMRTLGHLPIAARQKLQLIQVGDEKILIGVTADSISYITTVGKKEASQGYNRVAASFAQTMQLEAPPATATTKPTLKKMPGNDEATIRAKAAAASQRLAATVEKPTAPAPGPKAPAKPAPTRVAISVGEDGITDHRNGIKGAYSAPPQPSKQGDDGPRGVEDVTRLIREKLKSLKSMG